jgi:hypothetical protein
VPLVLAGCPSPAAPPPAPVAQPTLVPPLASTKVGEWIRLESGHDAIVYKIVGVADYDVKVEATTYHNDQPTGAPHVETWSRNHFGLPVESVIRAIDRDRIEVAGQMRDCWRFYLVAREGERFYWISDEFPVNGLVKMAGLQKGQTDEANAVRLVQWSEEH